MTAQAEPVTARPRRARRAWAGIVDAITFLTIVPMPTAASRQDEFDLSNTLAWFPLVGGAIGAFAGALRVAFQPLFGRGPSTAIAMVGLVLISGALHQDALADTADGLGVRGDRARRLTAMRDSSTGAFGVLALIGWALLLFSTLESLTATEVLRALIAACAAGRLAALLHAGGAPPARQDGLGAGLRIKPAASAVGAGIALAIVLAAAGIGPGAVSAGVCVLVSATSALFARQAIGGSTGDTVGAAVALTEVTVCLALLGMWH
ncbi:MAG: adenosylcobinamide-GDP ribazoletransferase [Solirubrobacteraceae bacterium]